MADNAMDQIKHLVVVMMENRSFDNLVSFLYAKEKNVPPANIPAPPPGQQPSYDGLKAAVPFSVRLNDLQAVMITAHRKRYAHGFGNFAKLKKFGTPPPKSRAR